MQNKTLPFSVTALAEAIANNVDNDTLALLAALFTQLGDTLATIAVMKDVTVQP